MGKTDLGLSPEISMQEMIPISEGLGPRWANLSFKFSLNQPCLQSSLTCICNFG